MIPTANHGRRVWLRVGTLLDGVSLIPQRNVHVVYDQSQILYVGDAEKSPPAELLNPGQRREDVDLPEHTLLPGLIEAHAHFFLEGGELNIEKRSASLKQTPAQLYQAALSRLEKLLRLGIIAVRDAGDKDRVGLALSKLYKSPSRPIMPYVESPGAAIYHRGRYGGFMGEPIEDCASLEECVSARVRAGADRIKLIPTGIINFKAGKVTSEPQMTAAEVSALTRAARTHGKQTFAHASGDIGISHAISGGVDSIEHGFFVREDQLAQMRDQQIAWVPTFAPVHAQAEVHPDMVKQILDQHAASLANGAERGVLILAGSDAGSYGVPHGLGLLEEMELMERAGLSSLQVLNAATGQSSNRLGFPEKFGQIRVGYQSRFILTTHSPLRGIINLMKPKTVIYDGAVFDSMTEVDPVGL
jgi:imidazolonepropionase-like amidohydrolase